MNSRTKRHCVIVMAALLIVGVVVWWWWPSIGLALWRQHPDVFIADNRATSIPNESVVSVRQDKEGFVHLLVDLAPEDTLLVTMSAGHEVCTREMFLFRIEHVTRTGYTYTCQLFPYSALASGELSHGGFSNRDEYVFQVKARRSFQHFGRVRYEVDRDNLDGARVLPNGAILGMFPWTRVQLSSKHIVAVATMRGRSDEELSPDSVHWEELGSSTGAMGQSTCPSQ